MRLAASQPPEARGLGRDGVRLLVATPDGMVHARFGDLPRFLSAGDLLVVNTSATIAAAVDGRRGDGRPVVVHFSSPLDEGTPWAGTPDGRSPEERALDGGTPVGPAGEGTAGETQWLVELREDAAATGPVTDAAPGETITLQAGGSLTLLRRYPGPAAIRMWWAARLRSMDGPRPSLECCRTGSDFPRAQRFFPRWPSDPMPETFGGGI